MEIALGAVIFWVVPIFVAHAMGNSRNRTGLLYGLFLGWLGVLVLAVLPPGPELTLERLERMRANVSPQWYERKRAELLAYRECPFCKEQMKREATVCPHCRSESTAPT